MLRAFALLCVTACTIGNGPARPPPAPVWADEEPVGSTYNSRIVALRTTLGRAGIGLKVKGADEVLWTSTCDMPKDIRELVGCARCDLAGEAEPIDDAVLDAMRQSFDRYPTKLLLATGMKTVALCSQIDYVSEKRDQPAGTADIYGYQMLLSIDRFAHQEYDATGQFTAEDIVHHELFHLLEWKAMNGEFRDDPEWRIHNPLGFEYGAATVTARPAGFVNVYATTNAVEDRASTFQYLMARPDELCAIAKADAGVRAKTKLLWARVKAFDEALLRDRATCVDWIKDR